MDILPKYSARIRGVGQPQYSSRTSPLPGTSTPTVTLSRHEGRAARHNLYYVGEQALHSKTSSSTRRKTRPLHVLPPNPQLGFIMFSLTSFGESQTHLTGWAGGVSVQAGIKASPAEGVATRHSKRRCHLGAKRRQGWFFRWLLRVYHSGR